MELGVVGDRNARLVVHCQLGGEGVGVSKLLLVSTKVYGLLGRLQAYSEPAMSSASQEESATEVCFLLPQQMAAGLSMTSDETRGRVLHGPVGVGYAVQREVVALVGEAEVLALVR